MEKRKGPASGAVQIRVPNHKKIKKKQNPLEETEHKRRREKERGTITLDFIGRSTRRR